MVYSKQTWQNGPAGGTPLSKLRLDHMEAGIEEASDRLDVVEPALATKAPVLTPTTVKTADYTAVAGEMVRVDATTGNKTITLPAVGPSNMIAVKKIDVSENDVIVAAAVGQTIDGAATFTLIAPNESIVLFGTANGWIVQSGIATLAGLETQFGALSDVTLLRGPLLTPNSYYFTSSSNSTATTNTLATGELRMTPFIITRTVTLVRIGAEISTVGEAGSKLRLGVYADGDYGHPSALVLDAGTINGDSATVQEITINLTLTKGIYWFGGVVQNLVTTQPTVRTVSASWTPPIALWAGNTMPASNLTVIGARMSGVTGALPSQFTGVSTFAAPRIFIKTAP